MSEPSKLKRNDSHVPEKWSLIFSGQDDIAPNSCEGVHVVNVCCVASFPVPCPAFRRLQYGKAGTFSE